MYILFNNNIKKINVNYKNSLTIRKRIIYCQNVNYFFNNYVIFI